MKGHLTSLYREHLHHVTTLADRALERAGCDTLVIYSGTPSLQFLDDLHYPYKVNPHFKAWVPVTDNPDCFIVYTPGQQPRLVFNQPVDFWHKSAPTPNEFWTAGFDLQPSADLTAARALLPAHLGRAVFVGEMPPALRDWGFGQINPQPLLDTLHYARAAKTPYEIECLREANILGARGHKAAERAFRSGGSEFEAHLAYLAACGLREEELPYNSIVGINTNSAVLHYQHLERTAPAERRSFLIDAGATFNGYASDITRTYSAAADDFASLIGEMDRMQQRLCAMLKAGVDWKDVHLASHQGVAQVLRAADVIRVDEQAAVSSGLTGVFYPHGLGHLLGLQVHDIGGFMRDESGATIDKPPGHPFLRLTRTLQPGFVVTVEPGLYFIDSLLASARAGALCRDINWDRVDDFRPFGGIRIEDNVVITSSGSDNLTRAAFAAAAA